MSVSSVLRRHDDARTGDVRASACVDGERLRFEPSIDRTGFKVEDKPIAHEWFEKGTKLSALGA